MNKQDGIRTASPEKRYKNFISSVADREKVWVLSSDEGYATWDEDGTVKLIVYPSREAAELFSENDTPEAIEVHEFLLRCRQYQDNKSFGFMVYPNGTDAFIVSTDKMIADIEDELDRIE